MSFKFKLAISILSVVLLTIAMGALVGVPEVRRSYVAALRSTLAARAEGVVALQDQQLAEARRTVARLARSPRIVATTIEALRDDTIILAQAAEAELRAPLERAGAGATFLFLKKDRTLLTQRSVLDAQDLGVHVEPLEPSAVAELGRLVGSGDEATTLCITVQNRIVQAIVSPVVDSDDDSHLGFLVLCLPFELPAPLQLEDGAQLSTGLLLGSTLAAAGLSPAGRASAEAALASAERTAAATLQCEFTENGEARMAYARPLMKDSAVQLVVFTSLEPMLASERTLFWRIAAAAGAALFVGLLRAFHVARVMSRPVAEMSAAAVAIEHGDYSARVPVRDHGELGQLAERFNAMGAGLALRDQYRRVLDAVTDPDVADELLAGRLDLGGRAQDVGILFCDIRGFTDLTEHMAPADVIRVVNDHMSLMTRVAYEHGGVVDKFVGDLIMVTFGAPKPRADDAAQMAACALAMIAERERANGTAAQRGAPAIHVGIGCAFGTVVAGCMGSERRLDYTVLGARVNLASRLCGKAPPMRVYIDAETRMRIPHAVCTALDPLQVKGFSTPIQAYELRGAGGAA